MLWDVTLSQLFDKLIIARSLELKGLINAVSHIIIYVLLIYAIIFGWGRMWEWLYLRALLLSMIIKSCLVGIYYGLWHVHCLAMAQGCPGPRYFHDVYGIINLCTYNEWDDKLRIGINQWGLSPFFGIHSLAHHVGARGLVLHKVDRIWRYVCSLFRDPHLVILVLHLFSELSPVLLLCHLKQFLLRCINFHQLNPMAHTCQKMPSWLVSK